MTTLIREKRLISLNSNNASSYYNGDSLSNLSFDFTSILVPDKSIIYVEGGLQSAQIPVSFYNMDLSNNVFNYRISGSNFNIQIPSGNYNYSTLVSVMTTLFTVNGHTFVFALNQATNKVTMTYTSIGLWQEIQSSSIYYILGFEPSTTYTIVANTFTYPLLFNLLGQKKLKIYSKNLAIDSYDAVGGNITSNLIETLSVNQPGYGMIIYNNIDGTYGHLKTSYLSTIDIEIKDELNNYINFNGIHWTMTMVLILFKRIETSMIPMDEISDKF